MDDIESIKRSITHDIIRPISNRHLVKSVLEPFLKELDIPALTPEEIRTIAAKTRRRNHI